MIGTLAIALVLGGAGAGHAAVRWERQFDEALRKSRASRKPLMVDFWADWCGWCHRLDKTTYADPVVVRLLGDFVTVKVDTESGPKAEAVAARYDVVSLPTILFLSPSGRVVLRLSGFQGPGQFPRTIETARETAARVMEWEAALEGNPSHPAALMELGVHMFQQEAYEESRDLLARARRVDGELPAQGRKRIRMLLGIMAYYDRQHAEAEALLKEALGLRPPGEYEPKLLYILGRNYMAWGRRAEARSALQAILDAHSQSPMAQEAREALVLLERR